MMKDHHVYLDYAASTPVDSRVVESMLPYFSQIYGNPSSAHHHGRQAEAALERAREGVAEALNCMPEEIVFTSCGSESDNLALRGAALAAHQQRNAKRILITPVEHHAVSHTAAQLQELLGFEVEFMPVDAHGMLQVEQAARMLTSDTALVSAIYANNEIGTINPIAKIGRLCRERGIPFHSDAVQAGAYLPLDVQKLNVDLMSLGAHKFYGPKGVGVLYIRRGTSLLPHLTGGSQEMGLRAGTHNIPYIVGLAEALTLAQSEREARGQTLRALRDKLIHQVLTHIPDASLTGHPQERLPNHASFVFAGVDGNKLLIALDMEGFSCSSGSACKTGDPKPSGVLLALGLPPAVALGSLRITLGNNTTAADLERLIPVLVGAVERLRQLENASPVA
ncbi:MAG: cysteine desulfurase family protein [Anaerolineales bacterium]|nr:cysteine desulfurase family protein [Anaerolineales bacterium]